MPHHIQVILTAHDFPKVDIGSKNALLLIIGAGEDLAKRADNATSPPHHDNFGIIALNEPPLLGRMLSYYRSLILPMSRAQSIRAAVFQRLKISSVRPSL